MSLKKKKTNDRPIDTTTVCYDYPVYVGTDIPLHDPQGFSYLSKKEIWSDFDADAPLEIKNDGGYSFRAKNYEDGELRVGIDVNRPSYPSKRAVLIVSEYGKPCQEQIVTELVKDGFSVFVPDYCGCFDRTLTRFPSSVFYGKANCGGEHMTKVCPTAKETCNYLYSMILRRAITFIEKEFGLTDVIILGIRNGVEYAMQAAGIDERIKALCCIGGAGYAELLSLSVYKGETPEMTPEKLAWMAGVSGISYLIGKDIRVFVGIGSNDSFSDPDRLSALSQLIGPDKLKVCICNGYADNVHSLCFNTLKAWLRLTFLGADFPSAPTVKIKPNSDGTVYAEINADPRSPISSINFCYAPDDYNHETRNWNKVVSETIGKGEYLARIPLSNEDLCLFSYVEVIYENGIDLCGPIDYSDLSAQRLPDPDESSESVIYTFGDPKSHFKEMNTDPVIFCDSIRSATIPIGLSGIVNPTGQMILFIGDNTIDIDEKKLLQVDCYSDEKDYNLVIYLTDDKGKKYFAQKRMYTDMTFEAALFNCTDFKSETYRPLTDWKRIKRLTIYTQNIVVSKLLFV